jgi:hypothetical protein
MGIEYYALNHERKEAFELGRRCYDDLLKLKTVEEYRKLMWDRLDPSRNFTKDFTEEWVHALADRLFAFVPHDIWSDLNDVYEYFANYTVVDSIYDKSTEIGVKLGQDYVDRKWESEEILHRDHPNIKIENNIARYHNDLPSSANAR